jgi:GNAT superfamily N-acetyltransferase
MALLDLTNGYYELPKGKLVNVVTCLEMHKRPMGPFTDLPEGHSLRRVDPEDIAAYRQIFKAVGEDNMWFSRLIMADDKLRAILANPAVESYILTKDDQALGVLELDFQDLPNCELAFFGLVKGAVGTGLGRCLMDRAKQLAWAKPISRFWVHTCHFDHPNALKFYQTAGFVPYSLMVEVHDDPRLQGKLPRSASPHVALLDPALARSS